VTRLKSTANKRNEFASSNIVLNIDAHHGARTGRKGVGRALALALRAYVDEVSKALPADEFGRPLAEHPMAIEPRVRRCTVGQDEHQGEGTKEGEDKFP